MLNLWWPDAAMYFNGAGQLYGSRFIYSSANYDMDRYYTTYNMLTRNYGTPTAINNSGNSIEVTWWGPGNQYITLSYTPDYSSGGYMRYYTTLSLGI